MKLFIDTANLEDIRAAIGREAAGKLVGIGRDAGLFTLQAKEVHAIGQHAHVIERTAHHIRDLGDAPGKGGLIEGFRIGISVYHGAAANPDPLMRFLHVTHADTHEVLWRSSTHLVRRFITGPVHKGFSSHLALGKRCPSQSGRVSDTPAALNNGPGYQVLRQGRCNERLYAHRSGALAH